MFLPNGTLVSLALELSGKILTKIKKKEKKKKTEIIY